MLSSTHLRPMEGARMHSTDLDSHHIEGFAHVDAQRRHVDIPLISPITGGLWTGGCVDGVDLPADFDFVLSLYPWEKYLLGPDTERVEYTMYDAGMIPDPKDILAAANLVKDRLALGQKVLVHCQAGLNRSGLIAGTTLVLMGYHPQEAISLLRKQRSEVVLCNRIFESWLLKGVTSA